MEEFESTTGVLNADAGKKLNLNLFCTVYLFKSSLFNVKSRVIREQTSLYLYQVANFIISSSVLPPYIFLDKVV